MRSPLLRASPQGGIEQVQSIVSKGLGAIHGQVGIPQQLAWRHLRIAERDPHAGTDRDRQTVYGYGTFQTVEDRAGECNRFLGILGRLDQDHELILAQAPGELMARRRGHCGLDATTSRSRVAATPNRKSVGGAA